MRGKIAVLALTALMILGLSVSNALAVNSFNYLGKTTWTATITDSTMAGQKGQKFTITGGISKVGGEFYIFQGYVTVAGDGPFVLSGSGYTNTTGALVFTLSGSQKHIGTNSAWRDIGVMNVNINRITLNGTFFGISNDFNTSTRLFDKWFTAGTLTRTGAPIPFPTSLAPLQ